jgi:hypothetical protein
MNRSLILLIFISINSSAGLSQKIITGVVNDTNSEPLSMVIIRQGTGNNPVYSDFNGVFHLTINDKYKNELILNHAGYKSVLINSIDTIQKLLIIRMETDSLATFDGLFGSIDPSEKGWGFTAFIQIDIVENNFEQFLNPLGDYNIRILNNAYSISGWKLAATYNRFQAGLNYGLSYSSDKNQDSLFIELNSSQYGLSFGYKIIDSRRIVITPEIALKWYRYRLINSDQIRRISLNQYMEDRDLDIRFNQTTGYIGTSLAYKIYRYNYLLTDYLTIGLYAGYLFKLNDYPWIYSKRNRLNSNSRIDMDNFNIGLAVSFNID